MKTINEQLDIVRKRIQDPKFLSGEGLSNEVNIHICCYDPKDEMIVRHFVGQITTDPSLNCGQNRRWRDHGRAFAGAVRDSGIWL